MISKKPVRLTAALLLLLVLISVGVTVFALVKISDLSQNDEALDRTHSIWVENTNDPSLYSILTEAHLCIDNTYQTVSLPLYPFEHYNANYILPFLGSSKGTLTYQVGSVVYSFTVDDFLDPDEEVFRHPLVEFDVGGQTNRLTAQNGRVMITESKKPGLFQKRKSMTVAELPSPDSFSHPISVRGLTECAVIVMSAADPAEFSSTRAFIFDGNQWTQASFVFPDGTQKDAFDGYVRRSVNRGAEGNATQLPVGYMELCETPEEGPAILYQVNYQDGALVLTQEDTLAPDALETWKF